MHIFSRIKEMWKMNTKKTYFESFGFGDVAVFCGAGISKNSGLPLANELKQYILEKLPIDKKDIEEIMASNLPFEAFMENISENIDISKILEIFEKGEPNTNHILIAKLAKRGYIKMIYTTNFDLLIEKALEKEELTRNIDFEVYHEEEQFSRINFENVEPDKIRIFKIHGSVANIDSLRTTMKLVASKTLSDKRFNTIRYLFSTGIHKKVLILGYSCSDELDITPQIQSVDGKQKEIIFIDHNSDMEKIEDIKIKDVKNPFKKFNGTRIISKTDNFIKKLWDSYKEMIGVYESIEFEPQWKVHIDNWVKDLEENEGLFIAYFIIGLLFQNISNLNKSIEYYEKSLEIGTVK